MVLLLDFYKTVKYTNLLDFTWICISAVMFSLHATTSPNYCIKDCGSNKKPRSSGIFLRHLNSADKQSEQGLDLQKVTCSRKLSVRLWLQPHQCHSSFLSVKYIMSKQFLPSNVSIVKEGKQPRDSPSAYTRNFIVPDYTGGYWKGIFLYHSKHLCSRPLGLTQFSHNYPYEIPVLIDEQLPACHCHKCHTDPRPQHTTILLLPYAAKQGSSPCQDKSSHPPALWSVITSISLSVKRFAVWSMKDPTRGQTSLHSLGFHKLTPYKRHNLYVTGHTVNSPSKYRV